MEVFKLLQIGDVHYPDAKTGAAPIDDKDPGFPSRVSGAVGVQPLQAVSRVLTNFIEETSPDVIAAMGDYTTKGDPTGLTDCVNYLKNVIPAGWHPNLASRGLFLIGNHDLARTSGTAADRFLAINAILAGAGLPAAPISLPSQHEWRGTSGSAQIYGVNSCIGCGETRFLPSVLKDAVRTKIDSLIASDPTSLAIDELREGIDTPVIEEASLSMLLNHIANQDPGSLAVICAHHNLLPQAKPRIAPYTELLNAGSIRNSLLTLDRPVVFLHGHIHEDPCEVIHSPLHINSNVICISAPLLTDGFNAIEFAFNSDGFALGARLRPYRRQGSQIVKSPPIDIPLLANAGRFSSASEKSREMLDRLLRNKIFNASDLERETKWPSDVVKAALVELQWLGLAIIENPSRDSHLWRVRRAI